MSIDARRDGESYRLYSDCGRVREEVSLDEHVQRCIEGGAGEIMIQSIDRDGTMERYDVGFVRKLMGLARVPVITARGSGNYSHLRDVFLEMGVSAAACGSLFNFSDSDPIRAKDFLTNYGLSFKVV